MERSEWIAQAEEYERRAQEAYEKNNIALGDYYTQTARACRTAADYAPEETEDTSDKK